MTRLLAGALLLFLCVPCFCAAATPPGAVLIVADEFPAMQVLANKLKSAAGMEATIVKQADMPRGLAPFSAVIVYIHGNLSKPAEQAFIRYTQEGGKLVLLHHSISSGKRANQFWTPFIGVQLPWGELGEGGYEWIEPVSLEFANLASGHYITSHDIKYDSRVSFRLPGPGGDKQYPGFRLDGTEVYLNHKFLRPKTVLLGFKYTDARGKVWMQDTAGWYEPSGKGWIFYFMPGHSVTDFENAIYSQIVVNAVTFQTER